MRWTSGTGAKGSLATARPSKSELSRPKTTKSTAATTAPDLSLASDSSRAASLRLFSTRSIFLARDDEDTAGCGGEGGERSDSGEGGEWSCGGGEG